MNFEVKHFEEFNLPELYRVLQIRSEVFVVEQACVYQDLDGKDAVSHHVLGYANAVIEAYTRISPPGVFYESNAAIGRVITTKAVRRAGHGRALMRYSISVCKQLYPEHLIKISAQAYLLKFYNGLGFRQVGEGYLEDGIPHIAMVLED